MKEEELESGFELVFASVGCWSPKGEVEQERSRRLLVASLRPQCRLALVLAERDDADVGRVLYDGIFNRKSMT